MSKTQVSLKPIYMVSYGGSYDYIFVNYFFMPILYGNGIMNVPSLLAANSGH